MQMESDESIEVRADYHGYITRLKYVIKCLAFCSLFAFLFVVSLAPPESAGVLRSRY